MPYIYSLAADVSLRGGTLMNAPALVYEEVRTRRKMTDQFVFGAFMFCPVNTPIYYNVNSILLVDAEKSFQVYLPGSIWYDRHTSPKLRGGKNFSAVPLDILPLYVPAGAMIAPPRSCSASVLSEKWL